MKKLLLLILPIATCAAEVISVDLSEIKEPQRTYESAIVHLLMIKVRECRINNETASSFKQCTAGPFIDYLKTSQLSDKTAIMAGTIGTELSMLKNPDYPEMTDLNMIRECVNSNDTKKSQKKCLETKHFLSLTAKIIERVRQKEDMVKREHSEYNNEKKQFEEQARNRYS
jgi:hypothetical protein